MPPTPIFEYLILNQLRQPRANRFVSIWLAPRVLAPASPEPHKKRGAGSPEPLVSTQPGGDGAWRLRFNEKHWAASIEWILLSILIVLVLVIAAVMYQRIVIKRFQTASKAVVISGLSRIYGGLLASALAAAHR